MPPSCSPCSGGQECFGRKAVRPRRSPHAAGTGRRVLTGHSRDGEGGCSVPQRGWTDGLSLRPQVGHVRARRPRGAALLPKHPPRLHQAQTPTCSHCMKKWIRAWDSSPNGELFNTSSSKCLRPQHEYPQSWHCLSAQRWTVKDRLPVLTLKELVIHL